MQVVSLRGARFYVIFKDDYSGWTVDEQKKEKQSTRSETTKELNMWEKA
jgi:hypothetical protein